MKAAATKKEEKKKEEVGFFFLALGLAVSTGWYLWTRLKKPEEPYVIIPSGSISLQVASGTGAPITEGLKGNKAMVTVHNTTVKQITHSDGSLEDVPIPYAFQVDVLIMCGSIEIGSWTGTISVPANGSQQSTLLFDIPFGITGTGICAAVLKSTEGAVLGDPVSVNFQIQEVLVSVGGKITWQE